MLACASTDLCRWPLGSVFKSIWDGRRDFCLHACTLAPTGSFPPMHADVGGARFKLPVFHLPTRHFGLTFLLAAMQLAASISARPAGRLGGAPAPARAGASHLQPLAARRQRTLRPIVHAKAGKQDAEVAAQVCLLRHGHR